MFFLFRWVLYIAIMLSLYTFRSWIYYGFVEVSGCSAMSYECSPMFSFLSMGGSCNGDYNYCEFCKHLCRGGWMDIIPTFENLLLYIFMKIF